MYGNRQRLLFRVGPPFEQDRMSAVGASKEHGWSDRTGTTDVFAVRIFRD